MDSKYEALFTPWKIGNVEIKNRIVLCPMGGTSLFGWMEHTGNHFDKEAARFFLEKAHNNVGLIIPGIAPIRSTFMGQWLYQNKKMFAELRDFMEEIHKTGAKLFIQITAGMGRSWAIPTPLVMLHNMPVVRDIIKPIINIPYQSASPSELPSRWLTVLRYMPFTKGICLTNSHLNTQISVPINTAVPLKIATVLPPT